ncbi:MAG: nucleoid-associated protein [Salibacteraceae bacterium]
MLDFSTVLINDLAIHRVGNKHNEEDFFISPSTFPLTEGLGLLMLDYFIKPFLKLEDSHQFSHEIDLSYNELNGICKDLFQDPSSLYINSVKILKHLHEQSQHPHIKTGDVFIAHFSDILYQDKMVQAIGIFKSENKKSFLEIGQDANGLELMEKQGIDIKKLDKGCFVFDLEQEDGYRVCTIDSNNYDTEYWMNEFLGVKPIKDEVFHTKEYVNLCKGFAEEVIQTTSDSKTEEINFLNKSVKYLEKNDNIDIEEFKEEVLVNEEKRKEFDQYKSMYEDQNSVAIPDAFQVSQPVLEKQKKKIKNEIKLDTNIQIKVSVNNPESTDRFIEKGYDHERDMNFYKVYYNNEL